MAFDEVICNARIRETQLYFKKYGEKNFKVKRRDSKHLHLICIRKEPCIYSIRCSWSQYGHVRMDEVKQTHSCSLQLDRKLSDEDTALLISSSNFCHLSNSSNHFEISPDIHVQKLRFGESLINSTEDSSKIDVSSRGSRTLKASSLNSDDNSSQSRCESASISNQQQSSIEYETPGPDSEFVFQSQEHANLSTSSARRNIEAESLIVTRGMRTLKASSLNSDDNNSQSRSESASISNQQQSSIEYETPGPNSEFVFPSQEHVTSSISESTDSDTVDWNDDNTSRAYVNSKGLIVLSPLCRKDNTNVVSQEYYRSIDKKSAADGASNAYSYLHSSADRTKELLPVYSDENSSRSQSDNKRFDKIMSIFDSLNVSSDQKSNVLESLRYLLQHQVGIPVVRELYLSYDKVHQDQMITELCMARSLRTLSCKDINFPTSINSSGHLPTATGHKSPDIKKRKALFYDYADDENEEEVTYLDKPMMIMKKK